MIIPEGVDIQYWAESLFVDFPSDDIPVLFDKTAWKDWGNNLVQCTSFAQNDAPPTNFYDDWNTWAWDVFYTMNNYA